MECIVCYETEPVPMKLQSHTNYVFSCQCNVLLHAGCLSTWQEQHRKCPICKKFMYLRTEINKACHQQRLWYRMIRHLQTMCWIVCMSMVLCLWIDVLLLAEHRFQHEDYPL